jgi:site-specific recombinase XerD
MHSLRGALAVAMIGNGAPIPVVSAVLGHASSDTTQAYYDADLALKQRALDRTTPPGSPPGRYQPSDQLIAFLEAI